MSELPEIRREHVLAAMRRLDAGEAHPFGSARTWRVEHDGKTYYKPGASTFKRQPDGAIARIASVQFGPGDVYCAPWHLFELLEGGVGAWEPRFSYESPPPGSCCAG